MDNQAPNPAGPEGNFQMPSVEELLKALENMDGIPEEGKQEIRDSLLARANEEKEGFVPPVLGAKNTAMPPDLIVLFSLLAFIGLVFVFFGYKLYKSLAERERRKEEKRRQKQQKKKK